MRMSKKSSNFASKMTKRQYIVPVSEITILEAEVVMDGAFPLAGSGSHGQSGGGAPERRTKAF